MWFIDCASMGATGMRIGRITTGGVLTWYPGGCIQAIAAGADGSIWYTGPALVRIDPATVTTTTFPVWALAMTVGPDGNLWFTESAADKIGRITADGTITEFPLPATFFEPAAITTGPDGNLWFGELWLGLWGPPPGTPVLLGQITTTGDIAGTGGPTSPVIAAGPDGNLLLPAPSKIERIPPTLAPELRRHPCRRATPLAATLRPAEAHGALTTGPRS